MCYVIVVALFVINTFGVMLLLTPKFDELIYNDYKYEFFLEN